MTKKGIVYCLVSIMLMGYLFFAVIVTNFMAAEEMCHGVDISVASNAMSPFVTADDIDRELEGLRAKGTKVKASEMPMQQIEDKLNSLDFVEHADVVRLANDRIAINVVPMVPVARVFDLSGSYYINRAGKHLTADINYQIDVPVVVRECGAPTADKVLPLIERIAEKPEWNQLVSAIKLDSSNDIILIPSISNHVVNFGDVSMIDDKFDRLFKFYRKVMPVKGWNYYDTITVKFRNQIVGKTTPDGRNRPVNEYRNEDFIENPDEESMGAETVTVGENKPKIS
ncbi:MAG: hypothetical protein J6R27_04255 [Muribaculaceae bacterium]|nr:hypothetical protein [Muribaculaceae bacterium]